MSLASRHLTRILVAVLLVTAGSWATRRMRAQTAPPLSALPGNMTDGTTLLPNGWHIQPAGKHVKVGDMPLNLTQTPDGKYIVVSSDGLAKPAFHVVEIATWKVASTLTLDNAWYGLAWHPAGTRLYSGGAAQNNVQELSYANGVITRARTFALPAVTGQSFVGGVAVAPDGKTLYVTRIFAQTVSAIDIASGAVTKTIGNTSIARAVLDEKAGALREVTVLLKTRPFVPNDQTLSAGSKTGGRIAIGADGFLYVTIGDRDNAGPRPWGVAQYLDTHLGKILRLTKDGKPAPGNPFLNTPNALPEIWASGFRTPEGLAFDSSGQLWETEHGPRGGRVVAVWVHARIGPLQYRRIAASVCASQRRHVHS